jgi:hypothetical protein
VAYTNDAGATWQYFPLEPGRWVVGLWPDGDGFGGAAIYSCCFGEAPVASNFYSMHSEDGIVWNVQQTDSPIPRAVVHRGENWVGISARDERLLHRKNVDTSGWTESMLGYASAVAAGDRFVAVDGYSGIWSSGDGATWASAALPAVE